MGYYSRFEWKPYVSVAERRRNAEQEMQKLRKKGHPVSPVVIAGRTIARTFWGKSWCENLERYGDYENRVPRGRTYVRNGSVVDLQIAPGEVSAWVSGSELYHVAVKISALQVARWNSICTDCAGAIDSLVELLQGRFSKGVMERICQQKTGLFPAPNEIHFTCSCPDSASMCKHIAAVLYGIGARFDEQPELLFKLRNVNETDLIVKAGKGLPMAKNAPAQAKVLAEDDLAALFGLDMDAGEVAQQRPIDSAPKPSRNTDRRKPAATALPKPAPRKARKVVTKASKKNGSAGATSRQTKVAVRSVTRKASPTKAKTEMKNTGTRAAPGRESKPKGRGKRAR